MIQKLEGLKTTLWASLIVALAIGLAAQFHSIWREYIGLIEHSLLGVFSIGLIISVQFSRSRITLVFIALISFYSVINGLVPGKELLGGYSDWLFIAVVLLIGLLTFLKDRSLLSIHGVMRVIFLSCCVIGAKLWLMAIEKFVQYNTQQKIIESTYITESLIYVPLYFVALFTLYRSLRRPNLLVASLLTSLVLVCLLYQQQLALPSSIIFALVALQYTAVVMIDSYYLAYRDELTNLPSRRALNQYALSLGRHYSVAMLDIDHFKKFNDTYGHDIGDQVLKLVASKLSGVKSGGKVFRYGGEEFTVIFPRKSAEQVEHALDTLRQTVANYKIVIRHPLRKSKKARKGNNSDNFKNVSVTISIGVATREAKATFEQTVKQADLALYRAKKNGRNNVSY